MKKTPKKIVEIATYMRNTGNFSLDIRYLTANEIGLIKAMISNDAVFESFHGEPFLPMNEQIICKIYDREEMRQSALSS